MTFGAYTTTLYTLARIFDVARDLLWRSGTWFRFAGRRRWHLLRTGERTYCGRRTGKGNKGPYPGDAAMWFCRTCTR